MRSSGRTTVSRTSARIDSVRRSRRGRRVGAVVAVKSVGGVIVFVVIALSVEEGARALAEQNRRPVARYAQSAQKYLPQATQRSSSALSSGSPQRTQCRPSS